MLHFTYSLILLCAVCCSIINFNQRNFSHCHLTLTQTRNFRLFQTERGIAEEKLKSDENDRKFFYRVEALWEKEKLLVMTKFSFSQSVFKRPITQISKKQGHVLERVNQLEICRRYGQHFKFVVMLVKRSCVSQALNKYFC